MQLFSRIPDRFFSILASTNKELYVQALFVLRQAFKTELTIRREELAAMLIDSLEEGMEEADLSAEAEEDGLLEETVSLSGKAHLLLRRLKETGWIESEYVARSFDEHITIPDYSIAVINLLYDISTENVREYNSYVYSAYAALASAKATPEYTFDALRIAWQNTVHLIDELKTLFNNIRRYYRLAAGENDVNELLREHFDEYKVKIFDAVYYPLKTMDSVPRFKHPIIKILNEWLQDDDLKRNIVDQGIARHFFEEEQQGLTEVTEMINYIADTYDGIDEMLEEIDQKHNEYTNASIEHIRYLMNADRGVKGNLIEILKHASEEAVMERMAKELLTFEHHFIDLKSLYANAKRTRRTEGKPLAVKEAVPDADTVNGFLDEVRKQFTNKKIDAYAERCFAGKDVFTTEEAGMESSEDFILFLLASIRGREKNAPYEIEFANDNVYVNGYSLPSATFRKKQTGNGKRIEKEVTVL